MASKVVNYQGFWKVIGQHVSVVYIFDLKLSICNQYSNIIMLNINMLSRGLAISIFCQDSTYFIIAIKNTSVNRFCNF